MCLMTERSIRGSRYPTSAGKWYYCEGVYSKQPIWLFAATMTAGDKWAFRPLYAIRIRAKWSRTCPS